MQKYIITVHNGSPSNNDTDISNNIETGGMYCIAMDYGNISAMELNASSQHLDKLKDKTSESNVYSEEVMGGMLHSISNLYFGQLDIYNKILAGQKNITNTRALSIGIVGFKINVTYSFNRPTELNEGGFFLDIGHDVHSVISNTNNTADEKTYMLQTGIYASGMEHGVLEQVTGIESISTIKTFQYAQENNIPIHFINKDNINEELDKITVDSQVKQEIRISVNSGKIVIIPENTITINQWSGVGYMVLDPDTFACGYMISGGLAGGSMTAGQMIGEYVGYVILGVISGILLKLMASCITTGWVGALFTIFKVALMMNWILELYDLYLSWETTGEVRYIQEMAVQLAAGATVYGLFKFGLRNKIQEFIKWANNINIGGSNNGTPSEGGSQGGGNQGEGVVPGEGENQGEIGKPSEGGNQGGQTSQQLKPGREILPKIRNNIYGETKL